LRQIKRKVNSHREATAFDTTALSIMTGFADYVNQGDEPSKSGVIRIIDKRLFLESSGIIGLKRSIRPIP